MDGNAVTNTTFNNWVRGDTTCPRDYFDLLVIGLILNDDRIINEYQHMYIEGKKKNTARVQIGKRIQKLKRFIGMNTSISEIINLTEEEEFILQNLENNLGEIITIYWNIPKVLT